MGLAAKAHVPDNVITPGVQVGDVKLGGKSNDAARALLQQLADSRQAMIIDMHFPDETGISRVWSADAHKLGLGIDVAATLDDATRTGRTNLVGQISQFVTGAKPLSIPARVTVDTTQLRAYLKQIAYRVNRKPHDASLVLKGNTIVDYRHDTVGLAMDVTGSQDAIAQAWTRYNAQSPTTSSAPTPARPAPAPRTETSTQATTPPVADPNEHRKPTGQTETTPELPAQTTVPQTTVPQTTQDTGTRTQSTDTSSTASAPMLDVQLLAKVTSANVTYADIRQINGVLGTKLTDIGGSTNRHSNVALAAKHINGTVLRPGEIFSYNKIVGPRDTQNGFKEAPEIVKGVLQPGIGGGVCQVSTTLYNAVLLANLKIISRSHHAFPVHYVSVGLDATVVDGSIDFQFQNDTDAPIYIYALGHDGELRFRIFGKKVPGREVSLERARYKTRDFTTETELDPTVPAGHSETKVPGHPEIEVLWYRVVKENGVEVKRDALPTHYHMIPEVVAKGAPRAAIQKMPKPDKPLNNGPTSVPGTPTPTRVPDNKPTTTPLVRL